MKQVKIAYNKCRAKLPNRPPDEIDFGLGFRAALKWLDEGGFYSHDGDEIQTAIQKELQ